MTEDQYRKLKREVEEAKTAADKAAGALAQLMTRLKEDFECEDLKSAKKLLVELEEKRDKSQTTFDRLQKEYEKTWKPAR